VSVGTETGSGTGGQGVDLTNLRIAVFSTRNLIFLLAVLAMNYTLSRPSPVDFLFITSFLVTLIHITLFRTVEVTRRAVMLSLLLGAWAVSYFIASLPHLGEPFVGFELLAKTFAISIGIIAAFVSMSWNRQHFETFMKVYIASSVIASIIGTIGFLLQAKQLTWDGRARALIDDPNMYASFLLPAAVFCAYFLSRRQGSRLVLSGALAVILLGILLSFSRIAIVAAIICVFAYIIFHNRRSPRRLLLIVGGLVFTGAVLFAIASLTSAEFSEKFLDRLTLAKSYDLGEEGRYGRYLLVIPMILQNPVGVGVLQLEKVFPEPIHNIWLSSFVNYGWGGGFSWIILAIGSVVVGIRNYRKTRSEITIALLISLVGIVMCASLHEGEHWRHMWLTYGLVWGFGAHNFGTAARTTGPNKQQRRSRSGSARGYPPAEPGRIGAAVPRGEVAGSQARRVRGPNAGVRLGQGGLAVAANPGE
jgi:hypothetical protein